MSRLKGPSEGCPGKWRRGQRSYRFKNVLAQVSAADTVIVSP